MFYSPNQAAKILGVHRETLRRWEMLGLLPFKVIKTPGGHRRYPQKDIHQLREQIITGQFPVFTVQVPKILVIDGDFSTRKKINSLPWEKIKREEPLVIAICSPKGGVGKSTTSLNLAAYMAKKKLDEQNK